MRTPLKNVLDLIHMSDVTSVKSTAWHEDLSRALQIIKIRRKVMWCHVCSYCVFFLYYKKNEFSYSDYKFLCQ